VKRIALLGQPYDSAVRSVGTGAGVDLLLEDRKLAERLEREGYDVTRRYVAGSEEQGYEIRRTLALDRQLATLVREAVDDRRFPIVLAGNCNSALGTTAGLARDYLAVAWFDAHADLDTPENNLSGFFDVFALSMLTGKAWQALTQTIEGFQPIAETQVVLSGVRDLEPYQAEHLRRSQIHAVYGDDIRSRGLAEAFAPALEAALAAATALYLHVDLDSFDPAEGIANRYAAPGGLTRADLSTAFEIIARSDRPVLAAAVTAYDPACDSERKMASTAEDVVVEIASRFTVD
jgi:arginase